MPRLPQHPPHERFFARLDRFECECPHCGTVMLSWQKRQRQPPGPNFDKYLQQLHCRGTDTAAQREIANSDCRKEPTP
jgi:hypothetical protein